MRTFEGKFNGENIKIAIVILIIGKMYFDNKSLILNLAW